MSWIFTLICKLLLVGSLLALTITETGHFDFTHKDRYCLFATIKITIVIFGQVSGKMNKNENDKNHIQIELGTCIQFQL